MAGDVDLVEYIIIKLENFARMVEKGINNLQSILLDSELKFLSIIPIFRELIEEIKIFLIYDEIHTDGDVNIPFLSPDRSGIFQGFITLD